MPGSTFAQWSVNGTQHLLPILFTFSSFYAVYSLTVQFGNDD